MKKVGILALICVFGAGSTALAMAQPGNPAKKNENKVAPKPQPAPTKSAKALKVLGEKPPSTKPERPADLPPIKNNNLTK